MKPLAPAASRRDACTVSQLAERLRGLVESALPAVWVQGEVSNFRNPSGHWYFTLKDAQAQIRVAMFKGANYHVKPAPKDGDRVLIRGTVSFYTARGDLQIIAEHLEPAGAGDLLRAFEALKQKLAAEGLFDDTLKRPLPAWPRRIGLITSPTGAALQDMLTTLRRRYPLGSVSVYPVPVQGEATVPAVLKALHELPRQTGADIVLLARGGGSMEDLWAFNDERIARAIRACTVPVVTGIGHEIDFTIADFAADLRAPTPTAAAELAAPDLAEWREQLTQWHAQGLQAQRQRLLEATRQQATLAARLAQTHPGRRLQQQVQRLDDLGQRLHASRRQTVLAVRARLEKSAALLASFNPRAVLERGYAIVHSAGGIVRRAAEVTPGAALRITLAEGALEARVTSDASG